MVQGLRNELNGLKMPKSIEISRQLLVDNMKPFLKDYK